MARIWKYSSERRNYRAALGIGVGLRDFGGAAVGAASALRFNLRTLMIATTLVAAACGFIVWAVR